MTSLELGTVLGRLRGPAHHELIGSPETRVSGVTLDSRAVEPGTMFLCIRGGRSDGHGFAAEAVERGATAVVVEHRLELPADVAQVLVTDSRAAAGPISAALFGHPSDALTVVGVTGTNGKTTTTHLLAAILDASGMPSEVIGTLTGTHTTPEGPDLQARLAEFRDAGLKSVVMEASSHALALHRVDGTRFAAGIFTNLGRDHLDLHGNEQAYFAAKARLFTTEFTDLGVVNVDDLHGRLLADACDIEMVGFGMDDVTDLVVTPTSHRYRWRGTDISVPVGGRFNAYNSLAAATTAAALGIELPTIAGALASVSPVPGRFESVDAGQDFSVVVDYAHTPDGLQVALDAAREAVGAGRVIVVFGCGGDRDQAKRPEMGRIAAQLADRVFVTSDNPRSEDPSAIIECIMEGVGAGYRGRVTVETDRGAAIGQALAEADSGDVVLIAGKGHEVTQTIASGALPFDDRAVARALLENRP